MVTSNKLPDKKVVKMPDQDCGVVVPQKTLLGEVNEHITCPLCRGYYIDATTIVECLHSFCRSCIIKHLQVKSYCPVCEMMINSARPNIKLDKALQDIVYKLVPGLFQREMERRQNFYASRPGPAATATPEQRGEDTERIIFSPEDVISFSLEYTDATDTDSISSKSSDSNEAQPASVRRYLQCPAVVNVNHLKKFLSMKYDIDSSQYAIDILYKRIPLPDYYTLMDIAYIFNWKRNEPMRFFYQIIDFIAMRNRLFDINRKSSHFRDRKSSPPSNDDVSSPACNLNEHGSEASSGTDSPMPEDNNSKQGNDTSKTHGKASGSQENINDNTSCSSFAKKNDDEVEKSQFLNSFELTAKSNSTPPKSSPTKSNVTGNTSTSNDSSIKSQLFPSKAEDTLKRKISLPNMPEMKKLKVEIEKTLISDVSTSGSTMSTGPIRGNDETGKVKEDVNVSSNSKVSQSTPVKISQPSSNLPKDVKQQPMIKSLESPGIKRPLPAAQNIGSPKRKPNEVNVPAQPPVASTQKFVSPLKLLIPKPEPSKPARAADQKPTVKKIPDLKPSSTSSPNPQNKVQPTNKVRMDLLANNCDPTMDRSKILPHVKTSLSMQNPGQPSGDHLKTLFDSCKINIPSSLSITLTDQKQDPRCTAEAATEQKKNVVNKNLNAANTSSTHKVPSPPVHNYIEILKLPDTDTKKPIKPDGSSDTKTNPQQNIGNNKPETVTSQTQPKPPNKTSEGSAKGPVPNLKPISDTKLAKQNSSSSSNSASANYAASPITFQQTFEQQLQSLQSDKKPKVPKNKAQVPKLVPANPKTFNAASKLNSPNNKPNPGAIPIMSPIDSKPSAALDLSSPSNIQGQLNAQQSKFDTMQSISNLAKKQSMPPKVPSSVPQSFPTIANRPIPTNTPLRLPSMTNINQFKTDQKQINTSSGNNIASNTLRQEVSKTNQIKTALAPNQSISPSYQLPFHNTSSLSQPTPRQTRSPSSSPKLVIAEDKQISSSESNINQSNQISSTQVSSMSSLPKSESPKMTPGSSKPGLKPIKPIPSSHKIPNVRQPIPPTVKPNPTPTDFQLISAHQALFRHMEVHAWLKAQSQRLMPNMPNMTHQAQNDYGKDKQ